MSLTGDPLTDSVVPAAQALAWAVKTSDADHVTATLGAVRDELGVAGLQALIVVLAAMVPDDRSPAELLAWRQNPDEYVRLLVSGVDASTALTLIYRNTLNNAA